MDLPPPSRARPDDYAAVAALLAASGLPHRDLTPSALEHFLTVYAGSRLVGVVGLEPYGSAGLLRSLAVAGEVRGSGLGGRLVQAVEAHARGLNVEVLYLLTTTAEGFFAARGYEPTARGEVPAPVARSAEFASLCPASAACLRKQLAQR